MMKRGYLYTIVGIICSVFVIMAIFLTSIQLVAFDKKFYTKQYEKNDTVHIVGTTREELSDITDELFAYLKGVRGDLYIRWNDGGYVFNQREIDHMKDVRLLFLYGFKLRNIVLLLAIFLLFLMAYICGKAWVKYLSLSFMVVAVAVLSFALIIAMGMARNFDLVWDGFHNIFFTNDLWLLDPDTDVLIMMMPGEFFMALIERVAFFFFTGMGILFVLSLCMYRRYGKNHTRAID